MIYGVQYQLGINKWKEHLGPNAESKFKPELIERA